MNDAQVSIALNALPIWVAVYLACGLLDAADRFPRSLRWRDLDLLDPMFRAKVLFVIVLTWPRRHFLEACWLFGMACGTTLGAAMVAGDAY